MTLKTLLSVAHGKIAIYKVVDDTLDTDFVGLYVGDAKEVPQEFLNRKFGLWRCMIEGFWKCR